MQKTILIILFSFFNLLYLRANNTSETNLADVNFEVTVSLTGETLVEYHDYQVLSTAEWQFEYGPAGFVTGQGITKTVSGMGINFYRFNLDPLKKYDFRVRENHFDGTTIAWTAWSQTKTVIALSDKVFSMGYSNNFNNATEANLEWRGLIYANSSSSSSVRLATWANHSQNGGTGSGVSMYNYNYAAGSHVAFISPKFNDFATDRKIKFWISDYDSSQEELLVGTMTNPNDMSTFHLLSGVTSLGTGWEQKTVYFNNYKGNDQYLVFLYKSKSYWTPDPEIYLDDFSYEQASNCYDQSNFAVTDIKENSVQLNFDALNQNNFEVSLTNLTRYTTEVFKIQGSPFVINNLVGNTDYEVKLRANCIDDLYSNWTKTISFKTPCSVVSDGYKTSFEGTKYINPCWSVIANKCLVQNSLEDTGWSAKPLPKTGSATIIMSKFTGALNVDKAYLITPYIDDLDADKRVKFNLLSYSSERTYNKASLTIGIMSDPKNAETFIPLKTILPSEMNEMSNPIKSSFWKEHTIYLDNYLKSNNHHYIALRYNNESDSKFSIDDFTYEKAPACLEPLNPIAIDFGVDFATVKWDNYKPATEWQIEYGAKGFEHGTGTIVNATSFPFKITESVLNDTEYDFYVRTKCGDGYSGWSDKGYFRTKCEGFTAGYNDDFETFAFEKSGCWTRIVPYFNDRSYEKSHFVGLAKETINVLAHSGVNSVCLRNELDVVYPTGTGEKTDRVVLVSPRLKDLDHYKKISFWINARDGNNKTPIEMIVGTLSNPEDYNTFTPYNVLIIPVVSVGKWTKYEIDFSNYYGTDKFIAFKQSKTNQRLTHLYIDDFEYLENDCPKPGVLGAKQSGSDSVSLDWKDNNTNKQSDSWDIEYGPKGFVNGTGTLVNVKTNPFNLTGLSNNIYDYRVRTYCEANITSEWSDRYTFKIGCTNNAPLVENFDQYKNAGVDIPNFCWTYNNHQYSRLLEYSLTNINSAPNVFSLDDDPTFNGDAGDFYLISPYLSDFDKNKRIKFWLFNRLSVSKTTNLIIGTIKNPLDLSTFEPYQTISYEDIMKTPKYGREFNIDFSKYNGTNKQIAFKFDSNPGSYTSGNSLLIDDIHYDQTFSCYEPIDIVFSNTNNNSVQINWTSKNQLPENVQIEYGLVGFVKGTGSVLNTIGNEIKVSNLQKGSAYEFYFKTTCGSGNSIEVGPRKIETSCEIFPLPWIEKLNNLSAYGVNLVPNCFKLLYGTLALENTAKSEVYSNYSSDYLRKGYDDNSYFYITGRTQIMTPMFHLNAGTTYKFSLKGRNSYEYRTQGVGLWIGRGQNDYNMESRLTGTGRLTEYNYSDLSYLVTPIVSGDYSFLMDFSNSGSTNLLADNFELNEGYGTAVDGNGLVAKYDFQSALTDATILEGSYFSSINIAADPANSGNKLIAMTGNFSANEWKSSLNISPLEKTTFKKTVLDNNSIWEINQNSITKINMKVNAKSTNSLFMSFDLKQTFAASNNESMFRVVVNGNVLGDVIKPTSSNGDTYENYVFDLTPYVGSDIRISLQHIGKSNLGDNAYLDNLSFSKTIEALSIVENDHVGFKYYPNPIENVLNIESNSVISNIEIFNISGQLLFEEDYLELKVTIDFKNYPKGVYLINVTSDCKKKTIKVIK